VEEKVYTRELMVAYLLGLLPRVEQQRFEADLLADDRLLEELGATEDDLIDDYLNGELSQSQSEGFESHFLRLPEHQRKLIFATSFKAYVAKSQSPEAPGSRERTRGRWRRLISRLRK
jgi:anti-sigma factor RsiW